MIPIQERIRTLIRTGVIRNRRAMETKVAKRMPNAWRESAGDLSFGFADHATPRLTQHPDFSNAEVKSSRAPSLARYGAAGFEIGA